MVTKTRKPPKAPTAPAGVLQLHIELRDLEPKVWRRVLVPDSLTLDALHDIIQAAFGWDDSHLHQFTAGKQRYGSADLDFDSFDEVRSEDTRLVDAMTKSRTIDYMYDFGDSWEHRVKVEKVLPPAAGMQLPVCVDGANAAPPEDCGGAWGYAHLVEAMADPGHTEHEDLKSWLGDGDWDPKAFDVGRVNQWQARVAV
jgi:hypothetical protein